MKRVLVLAIAMMVGCMTARHSEECTDACLSESDEAAIEHLTARLDENRAELEKIDNPAQRYVLLEVIAGIEAHIAYIKAGRMKK